MRLPILLLLTLTFAACSSEGDQAPAADADGSGGNEAMDAGSGGLSNPGTETGGLPGTGSTMSTGGNPPSGAGGDVATGTLCERVCNLRDECISPDVLERCGNSCGDLCSGLSCDEECVAQCESDRNDARNPVDCIQEYDAYLECGIGLTAVCAQPDPDDYIIDSCNELLGAFYACTF